MCFTPWISVSTTVIEFILATTLLIYFKKGVFSKFAALFIYLLGFYQFTEFMLCTTSNFNLWARLGFITYTFLPALGLHSALRFLNRKPKLYLIYIVPVFFSLFAILSKNFIFNGSCERFFITVKTTFFNSLNGINLIANTLYWIYYSGFILTVLIISYLAYKKEKNKTKKKVLVSVIISILVMTLPTFILIIIFPTFGIQFPSVLCQFALLLAIVAFIGANIENKSVNNKKN